MEKSRFFILDGGSATELVRQGHKSIDVSNGLLIAIRIVFLKRLYIILFCFNVINSNAHMLYIHFQFRFPRNLHLKKE